MLIQVFSYSIVAGIALAVLYGVYRLLLAGANQPAFNRAMLLLILAVSMIAVPAATCLLSPSEPGVATLPAPTERISVTVSAGEDAGVAAADATVADASRTPEYIRPVLLAAIGIYSLGTAVSLILWLCSLARMARILLRGRKVRCDGYTVVITPEAKRSPFSWGRYICMDEEEYESAGAAMTLSHERRHVAAFHTLDLLAARAAAAVCWYNPAAWMLLRSLKDVHEYEADGAVIADGADASEYQMMLINKVAGVRLQSCADNLYHSKLKKRITMMQKMKSKKSARMGALALMPATVLALAVCFTADLQALADRCREVCGSEFKISEKSDIRQVLALGTAGNTLPVTDAPEEEEPLRTSPADQTEEPVTAGRIEAVSPEQPDGETGSGEIKEEAPAPASTDDLPEIYVDGKFLCKGASELQGLNPADIESMSIDKSGPVTRINVKLKKPATESSADGKEQKKLNLQMTEFNNYGNSTTVKIDLSGISSLTVNGARLINNGRTYQAKAMKMKGSDDRHQLEVKFKRMTVFKDVVLEIDTDMGTIDYKIDLSSRSSRSPHS